MHTTVKSDHMAMKALYPSQFVFIRDSDSARGFVAWLAAHDAQPDHPSCFLSLPVEAAEMPRSSTATSEAFDMEGATFKDGGSRVQRCFVVCDSFRYCGQACEGCIRGLERSTPWIPC